MEEHRRSRGRLVIWLLVFAVAMGSVISGVTLARYQPVSFSSNFNSPGSGVARVPEGDYSSSSDSDRFFYRDDGEIFFGGRIHNDGRVTVIIESLVPEQRHEVGLGAVVEAKTHGCCVWDGDQRARFFRPFRLDPGENVDVIFRATMKRCEFYPPGSGSGIDRATITYKVLGVTKQLDVGSGISIFIPSEYRCPRQNPYPTHSP